MCDPKVVVGSKELMEEITGTFPEVKESDIKFLWYNNKWDGKLSGMAEVNGDKVYFDMFYECFPATVSIPAGDYTAEQLEEFQEALYKRTRLFKLIKLTPEALNEELKRHECFQQYVGTHNDCGGPGELRPTHLHHIFYDKYPSSGVRRPEGEIVGWFKEE